MTMPWTCGVWAVCLQVSTAFGIIEHIVCASAAHMKATAAVKQHTPGWMLAVFFSTLQHS